MCLLPVPCSDTDSECVEVTVQGGRVLLTEECISVFGVPESKFIHPGARYNNSQRRPCLTPAKLGVCTQDSSNNDMLLMMRCINKALRSVLIWKESSSSSRRELSDGNTVHFCYSHDKLFCVCYHFLLPCLLLFKTCFCASVHVDDGA